MQSATPTADAHMSIGSNILVYDKNAEAIQLIKSISEGSNIIIPKREMVDILGLLQATNFSDTDVCAVFVSEEKDENGLSGFELAKVIHRTRNNIPIFVRLTNDRGMTDLSKDQRSLISGCYTLSNPDKLREYTDKFLYGFYFPHSLVNIFVESGHEVLAAAFKGCEVRESKPFLVYDHLITTEYTSLLPVQFSFGNGVLTFLIKEEDAISLIVNEHTSLNKDQASNDHLNQLISEVMNLFWGKIRYRCEQTYGDTDEKKPISIPLVVNHKKNYISFGNHTPQLCFRYILLRDAAIPEPYIVEFKMMFNRALNPKDFPVVKLIPTPENEDGHFELF